MSSNLSDEQLCLMIPTPCVMFVLLNLSRVTSWGAENTIIKIDIGMFEFFPVH